VREVLLVYAARRRSRALVSVTVSIFNPHLRQIDSSTVSPDLAVLLNILENIGSGMHSHLSL
jgi:hypothetical protein